MTSAISKYQYQHLPSTRHIRLLVLHPDSFPEDISCELVFASLDDLCVFEALSYVWGEPFPRNKIRCSGKAAEIGYNLHAALRHLRYEDKQRVLWADALCINQENNKERGEQV